MTTTQNTATQINARFTNLTTLDDGEFITAASVITMSTIDTDDRYTATREWSVADFAPEADFTDYANAVDFIVEELNLQAEEVARLNGLTVTGQSDGDGQFFWTVAPARTWAALLDKLLSAVCLGCARAEAAPRSSSRIELALARARTRVITVIQVLEFLLTTGALDRRPSCRGGCPHGMSRDALVGFHGSISHLSSRRNNQIRCM